MLTYVGLVGAVVGSFLNVVIARLPAGESLVRPRSRCPHCHTTIRWYDNIPVVSWLVLRARCRHCGAPISARYPLVELLMAALALAVYARLGPTWLLLEWLPLVAAMLAVTFLDIDHWWVPDVITFPAMAWALAGALLPGGIGLASALWGLAPALFLWGFAWLFERVMKREGMGLGDVKLLAVIGLAVGPLAAVVVLLLASLQGSVVGLVVILTGGHNRAGDGARPSAGSGPTARDTQEATPEVSATSPADTPEVSATSPASQGDEDDDWIPHPRAIPFGPFLVLATYEVLLLPEVFVDKPLALMRLAGWSP